MIKKIIRLFLSGGILMMFFVPWLYSMGGGAFHTAGILTGWRLLNLQSTLVAYIPYLLLTVMMFPFLSVWSIPFVAMFNIYLFFWPNSKWLEIYWIILAVSLLAMIMTAIPLLTGGHPLYGFWLYLGLLCFACLWEFIQLLYEQKRKPT